MEDNAEIDPFSAAVEEICKAAATRLAAARSAQPWPWPVRVPLSCLPPAELPPAERGAKKRLRKTLLRAPPAANDAFSMLREGQEQQPVWVLDDGVWRLGLITRQVGHSAAQRGRTRAVWRGGRVPPARRSPHRS